MNPLFYKGYKTPLEFTDIWAPPLKLQSNIATARFESYWIAEQKRKHDPKKPPNFGNAITNCVKWELFEIALWKIISDTATVTSPLVLKYFIAYINRSGFETTNIAEGFVYVISMFLLSIINSILFSYYFQRAQIIGIQAQTATSNLIYRKALKLSAAARQKFDSGKVVNMVSTDCQRIMNYLLYIDILFTAPIQILFILAMMLSQIGPAALAGVGLLLIMTPAQGFLFKKLSLVRRSIAPITDERVKLTTEILAGIRIIKFFAWEVPFLKKLESIREKELTQVLKRSVLNAVAMAIVFGVPVFCSTLSFMIYSFNNTLSAEQIFPTLTWFGILRFPLMFIPNVLVGVAEFRVAVQRIQELLDAPELEDQPLIKHNEKFAISVTDAEFVWEAPPVELTPPAPSSLKSDEALGKLEAELDFTADKSLNKTSTIRNINLQIPHGALVAIVGRVGSGKSSLLNALIGEMKRIKGSVELSGTIGYCPQSAWIQNASVKENILFGLPFDKSRYTRAIQNCSLERDFKVLVNGDATEIGERGINLSGGQKQRVNLARCVFVDSDIILMDDPLSAVDAHVGNELFENCILALNTKTRLLVTHQLHFLPRVDYVIVMDKGQIAEQGTFQELINANGDFALLMASYGGITSDHEPTLTATESDSNTTVADKRISNAVNLNDNTTPGKDLMSVEERAVGKVSASVWAAYIASTGGSIMVLILMLALIVSNASNIGNNIWLVQWTNLSVPGFSDSQYIGIFWIFGFGQILATFTTGITFTFASVRAARILHSRAADRILRTPISFFDQTPLGRIINRFSKDQDSIDNTLADSVRMFLMTLTAAIGSFILIIYATPLFAVPIVPLLGVYYFMQEVYRATSRELKRLDSLSRSPLYSHFGETMVGLATIRAYGKTAESIAICGERLDNTNGPYFVLLTAQRWLALRLETIGSLIVFFAAVFGVLARYTISPAVLGLSLSYAIQITSTLSWCVRQFAESEIAMNAVERVNHFGTELEMEAEPILEHNRAPKAWPLQGTIEFRNVDVRYKAHLPLVLKNVSMIIGDKMKVGIVGRTGSGKSTLMNALFRIMEISSGSIIIDNIDTLTIGLDDLRKKLAIIPQDPVLFSGSFRSNLDPFDEYEDIALWSCLERSNLKDKVVQEGGLEGLVLEGGENLSVGQKQLLCLARAMLKNARIVVMDEATANVDFETDAIIQRSLRADFENSTILTIAHRLNTIIDYDRVIVFDNGVVVENASPRELLDIPDGVFAGLVNETGAANAAALKLQAK